jgi:hypothetical protein
MSDEPQTPKTMDIISEILNDRVVMEAFARDAREQREKRFNDIVYSQYSFSIIYHPSQKNRLGVVDSFSIEGGYNAQYVLDLKIKYNVGISEIRIRKNGVKLKTLHLENNEEVSLPFRGIKLFK